MRRSSALFIFGESVRKVYEEVLVPAGMGDVAIFTELGRFMLAPYGALVTRAIHEKHTYKEYIGVDACAVNLMRPAMYGAYHHITVMGKENEPCDHKYDVTGSLCENNDKFAIDRMLPKIDMVVSAVHCRTHQVYRAGIHTDILFVSVLLMDRSCDKRTVRSQHETSKLSEERTSPIPAGTRTSS